MSITVYYLGQVGALPGMHYTSNWVNHPTIIFEPIRLEVSRLGCTINWLDKAIERIEHELWNGVFADSWSLSEWNSCSQVWNYDILSSMQYFPASQEWGKPSLRFLGWPGVTLFSSENNTLNFESSSNARSCSRLSIGTRREEIFVQVEYFVKKVQPTNISYCIRRFTQLSFFCNSLSLDICIDCITWIMILWDATFYCFCCVFEDVASTVRAGSMYVTC